MKHASASPQHPECTSPVIMLAPDRDDTPAPFYSRDALTVMAGRSLFYPCSGGDLVTPIRLFAPHILSFWFVDTAYFRPGHQNTRYIGLDLRADKITPVLADHPAFSLLQVSITGPVTWPCRTANHEIEPCIRSEIYEHLPSGKAITVNLRRGYGYSGFLNEDLGELGIFFYRGDSGGEGGSGAHWLHSHMDMICSKLVENGLLVTDGPSKWQTSRGKYGFLCNNRYRSPQELTENPLRHTDRKGRIFTCIGYAGHRCGPTLIWRVSNIAGAEPQETTG